MKKIRITLIVILALFLSQTGVLADAPSMNDKVVHDILNPPKPADLESAAAHGNKKAKVLLGVCAVLTTTLAVVSSVFPSTGHFSWPNR
jgi:hypothetical protein